MTPSIQINAEAKKMKNLVFILLALAVLAGCAGGRTGTPGSEGAAAALPPALLSAPPEAEGESSPGLAEIAEIERAGAYFPGLGLAESGLREKAGDLGGSVIAAYKELSWAYGYGRTGKDGVEDGIRRTLVYLENLNSGGESGTGTASRGLEAAQGALAFSGERWDDAARLISGVIDPDDDPDSFSRWMLLVCTLETGKGGAGNFSAYGAIRARYSAFPEYWYRGARAFAGSGSGAIASMYAEECVNLSPDGPFAGECRRILAGGLGLTGDGRAIRSKAEIEDTISRALSAGDPELLDSLLPLMDLPDNTYTLYAMGALKVLASTPEFRRYFQLQAAVAGGRLAERLAYINRG
jgi:hypothetical protein